MLMRSYLHLRETISHHLQDGARVRGELRVPKVHRARFKSLQFLKLFKNVDEKKTGSTAAMYSDS